MRISIQRLEWICNLESLQIIEIEKYTPGTLKGDQKVPKIGELLIPVGVLACARTVQLMN
jgi:hypothetical protein